MLIVRFYTATLLYKNYNFKVFILVSLENFALGGYGSSRFPVE